jgi:hypothetical protein
MLRCRVTGPAHFLSLPFTLGLESAIDFRVWA